MSWKLNRQSAVGISDGGDGQALKIQVEAARPTPGVVEAQWGNEVMAGFWIEVRGNIFDVPPSLDETYVRGRDLVCRYSEHRSTKLTPTLYWSLMPSEDHDMAVLDLRLAVQTSTLGTQPEVDVQWHFAHSKVSEFRLSETLIDQLFEPQNQPLSFLDRQLAEQYQFGVIQMAGTDCCVVPMVHLSDYRDQTVATDAESLSLRQSLELPLLEKGVIRTARVRCLFSRGLPDEARLLREAVDFFESDLPLTT